MTSFQVSTGNCSGQETIPRSQDHHQDHHLQLQHRHRLHHHQLQEHPTTTIHRTEQVDKEKVDQDRHGTVNGDKAVDRHKVGGTKAVGLASGTQDLIMVAMHIPAMVLKQKAEKMKK